MLAKVEFAQSEFDHSDCSSWPAVPIPPLERAGRLGSWHLPRGNTLSAFCEALNDRAIAHAILRTVPSPREREPIEVLVSDEDIPRVLDLITRVPLGQQLAVYSATGMPGFAFQQRWRQISDGTNMALLPSHLANALIERAQVDEQNIRVPSAPDMLLWTIYRALYLSGDAHFAVSPEHGEAPILVGPPTQLIRQLSRETAADLPEPFTLEALDRYLAASGWGPPHDLLRRISCWNSWAAFKTAALSAGDAPETPGMVVFFIRRETVTSGLAPEIAGVLEGTGFELLETVDLTEEQIETATRSFRGGDWGAGASAFGGGPPVRLIFAYDALPNAIPEQMRLLYPNMDNGRILRAKQACRQFMQLRMPPKRRFNPLHSTDTSAEAWTVVRKFAPDHEERLRETIEARDAAMVTQFEVVRDLTRKGDRAKIELIRYQGGLAVKKTFRQNCLRFLDREASFMDAVSPERPEILPLLERGDNYFITTFVNGPPLRQLIFGRPFPKLMSFSQVRSLADLMHYLFARGYDPVDFAPYNLLIDGSGTLKAIDFEFIHLGDSPLCPESSACLTGIKEGFAGEWTPGALWDKKRYYDDPYNELWFAHTGLTLRSFLYDSPSLQRIKRFAHYPVFLVRKALRHGNEVLREQAKQTLRRRLPVLTRAAVHAFRSNAR